MAEQEVGGVLEVDYTAGNQLITDRFIEEELKPRLIGIAYLIIRDGKNFPIVFNFKDSISANSKQIEVDGGTAVFMVNDEQMNEVNTEDEIIADIIIASVTHRNPFFSI